MCVCIDLHTYPRCCWCIIISHHCHQQTVANFYLAFEQDLALLPVLNKIDLPAADPESIEAQLETTFDIPAGSAVRVSAKTGLGIDRLLPAIVE